MLNRRKLLGGVFGGLAVLTFGKNAVARVEESSDLSAWASGRVHKINYEGDYTLIVAIEELARTQDAHDYFYKIYAMKDNIVHLTYYKRVSTYDSNYIGSAADLAERETFLQSFVRSEQFHRFKQQVHTLPERRNELAVIRDGPAYFA